MTLSPTIGISSTSSTEISSQLGHWLEEYTEIAAILPVVAGLLVTTQLRLRGGPALLVNIAIAAAIRQAILQLKKQASPTAGQPTLVLGASNGAPEPAADEDYTIVHSVPGRIRLRISHLRSDAIFAKRLDKLLLSHDLVLSARINRAASSVAIVYDRANLTELELGMQLLHILEQAEQDNPAA